MSSLQPHWASCVGAETQCIYDLILLYEMTQGSIPNLGSISVVFVFINQFIFLFKKVYCQSCCLISCSLISSPTESEVFKLSDASSGGTTASNPRAKLMNICLGLCYNKYK